MTHIGMHHDSVCSLFMSGLTQEQVGAMCGITRQRVQQILKKHGLRAKNGGQKVRENTRDRRKRLINERFTKRWGISKSEGEKIKKIYGYSPFFKYRTQRNNSKRRGIDFRLKFSDWWCLWQESGKWEKRGVTGYVMTRHHDKGAYELGNVTIKTCSENMYEHLVTSPADIYIF